MKVRRPAGWSTSAWIVVLITLVGALLRFYRLDAQSFWGDEAFSAVITAGRLSDALNNPLSVNPPGYFLVLNLWRSLAGGSDFALRFPSALLGVLGIPLTYRLGREIRGRSLGAWAASITALAPYHVFYSQEARMYTQLHSLACVLMLAYVRLWRGGRRAWWLVVSLASMAGLWTHFFAGFAIALLAGYFFLLKLWSDDFHRPGSWSSDAGGSRPSWLDFIVANGAVLLLFGSYAPRFLSQVQMYESETWHESPSIESLVGLPSALTAGQFLSRSGQTMAFVLMTFLVIIVALQIVRALWQRSPAARWLLLLSMLSLVPPTAAFLIARVWKLVFATRILIISVPAFYLLLAWSATHTRERRFNQLMLVGLFILMGWGLHNWYFDPSFAKPPIRDAAHYVQGSELATAPVMHGTGTSYRLFQHYARDLDNHLLSGSPLAQRVEQVIEESGNASIKPGTIPFDEFWYVVFPVHSLEFQLAGRDDFDAEFDREHEWDVDGIQLVYYANRDR